MPDSKSLSCSPEANAHYLREQVMYHSEEIIKQLQDNNILAANALDRAVAGVRDAVRDQVEKIDAGKTRLINYGSCFTTEFYEKCTEQKSEDHDLLQVSFTSLRTKPFLQKFLRYILKLYLKAEIFDNCKISSVC